ncbi:MAG TPA: hypothetical protein VFH77_05320 [Streptomyces sp.]|nr:hypothetical protein [Streptomyces sp.]
MTDIPRPRTDASGEPAPEPIRFYGTTWVDHSGGYAARRAGLVLAALALAALGALVLRLAYLGFAAGETGDTVNMLLVVAFAVCSSVGFTRTLNRYRRRPDGTEDEARERSMRSILVVGFLGVLLAYAARTLVEAPGERLRREDYEEELARHRKRSRRGKAARRKRTR